MQTAIKQSDYRVYYMITDNYILCPLRDKVQIWKTNVVFFLLPETQFLTWKKQQPTSFLADLFFWKSYLFSLNKRLLYNIMDSTSCYNKHYKDIAPIIFTELEMQFEVKVIYETNC